MSNYIKATNFASKDALSTGNALKTVSGTEIDDEYTAIATAVATKANTASPTLTGTPAAPTAAASTNSTQIATAAFTQAAITAGITAKAPLASPSLTGTPTAPTASASTNTTQLATTAYTTTAVATAVTATSGQVTAAAINALVYPVGSVFTTVTAYSASALATLMGLGTWVAFAAGKTLVGLNSAESEFDTVGEIGGSKTHTLTTAQMPTHNHGYAGTYGDSDTDGSGDRSTSVGAANSHPVVTKLENQGGGAAHNNLQPYIVVYFWKRTA